MKDVTGQDIHPNWGRLIVFSIGIAAGLASGFGAWVLVKYTLGLLR